MNGKLIYKIAVLGLWHLGEIYSAGLAELGHQVVGIDADPAVIKNFLKNTPPLSEPRLADLIKSNQASGRLTYTTDFTRIKDCNVLWITFDTPVDDNDNVNLSQIYYALEKSLPYLQANILLVISSQLPIGTSKKIKEYITKKKPDLKFDYVYTPENLRLGEAVQCFLKPERIVVGTDSSAAFNKIQDILSGLRTDLIKMSSASAEMAKHALNAFLATSLSFIYDIADVCEATGADVVEVTKALRADSRIGYGAYLDASLGFSGGTLGRDLQILLSLSKDKSVALPVIESVFKKNRKRGDLVLSRLKTELGDLEGKSITVFGLTYKAGTSTLRRSLAMEIVEKLRMAGVSLRLYDPQADRADILRDPYEAVIGARAVIIMTPWPEFKNLDLARLRKKMLDPAIFFDTRNFFYDKEEEIKTAGFQYLGIGR